MVWSYPSTSFNVFFSGRPDGQRVLDGVVDEGGVEGVW